MGMGKKSAPPKQEPVAVPTVTEKPVSSAQSYSNAAAQARANENEEATLLKPNETKQDDELLKRNMGVV